MKKFKKGLTYIQLLILFAFFSAYAISYYNISKNNNALYYKNVENDILSYQNINFNKIINNYIVNNFSTLSEFLEGSSAKYESSSFTGVIDNTMNNNYISVKLNDSIENEIQFPITDSLDLNLISNQINESFSWADLTSYVDSDKIIISTITKSSTSKIELLSVSEGLYNIFNIWTKVWISPNHLNDNYQIVNSSINHTLQNILSNQDEQIFEKLWIKYKIKFTNYDLNNNTVLFNILYKKIWDEQNDYNITTLKFKIN